MSDTHELVLFNVLLIITLLAAIVCLEALLGRAFSLGWILRSLTQALKNIYPGAARRLGLGDEVVEKLRATEGTAALLGRECEVEVAIENGYGRVLIGGVSWSAEGSDMPAGTPVRVVSVDANRVVVERYTPEK